MSLETLLCIQESPEFPNVHSIRLSGINHTSRPTLSALLKFAESQSSNHALDQSVEPFLTWMGQIDLIPITNFVFNGGCIVNGNILDCSSDHQLKLYYKRVLKPSGYVVTFEDVKRSRVNNYADKTRYIVARRGWFAPFADKQSKYPSIWKQLGTYIEENYILPRIKASSETTLLSITRDAFITAYRESLWRGVKNFSLPAGLEPTEESIKEIATTLIWNVE